MRAASRLSLGRRELKFLIDEARAAEIMAFASPFLRPDPYGQRYSVRSIYFDAPDLSLWADHELRARQDRYKLRVRCYGQDGGPVFFEVKRKKDGLVSKLRAPVGRPELPGIWASIYSKKFPESPHPTTALQAFLELCRRRSARPAALVTYEREAYGYMNDARVTFDTSAAFRLPDGRSGVLTSPGQVILELKFDGDMPELMREVCARFGLRRVPFSKYIAAILCGASGSSRPPPKGVPPRGVPPRGVPPKGDDGKEPPFPEKEMERKRMFGGFLFYCSEDQTILLIKRSPQMKSPGTWDLPGGHQESEDEGPMEAALREGVEELSALPHDRAYVGEHVVEEPPKKKGGSVKRRVIFMYDMPLAEKLRFTEEIELDRESSRFKWFRLDEIPENTHFDMTWIPERLAEYRPGLSP